MKKITLITVVLLFSAFAFSQKKEKLKGSKIVTIEQKQVESFDAVELHDNIEVSLVKGDKSGVELEADDNLQSALGLTMNGSTLVISFAKEVSGFKKFNIRVTYTDSFKTVITRNKSKANALEEMKLEDITFRAFDDSRLYLNLNVKSLNLVADDKSRAEINSKSESANIELSKNAELKALIASTELKCDLYQKASGAIEGDVIDMKLRLDNNSGFTGKKLTCKNMQLITEGYASCSVFAETAISIEASGNSEIQLSGEPKIDMKKFTDSASLKKKPAK